MARTPSLETIEAVNAMKGYYCNSITKCLPRGSYKVIAQEIDVEERIVSKNARLQEKAHIHHEFDDERQFIDYCWICKERCK